MKEHIKQFDYQVTRAVQSFPSTVGKILALITHLGSEYTSSAIIGAIIIFSWFSGEADLLRAALLGAAAMAAVSLLKLWFRRKRPDTPYAANLRGFSFPSGHSGHSLTVYGLLADLSSGEPVAYVLWVLIFLVGLSRIYLGAHFPSDVIGAWLFNGTALALIINNLKS